jgi:translation initiation factor eIF-2B subunit alpha
MFELAKALNHGAETLRKGSSNPISINAGCELFITFVTSFPHASDVSMPVYMSCPLPLIMKCPSRPQNFADLKCELVKQGQRYAAEASTYRVKIANLVFDFIKDDAVVCLLPFPSKTN